MEIKEIAETILQEQQETSASILEIFMTGSNVFSMNRNVDNDYVVICENYGQRKRRTFITIDDVKYDILIMDINAVKASLDFDDNDYIPQDIKLYSYFYDTAIRKTVYGQSDLDWSMLNFKTKYLNYIKNFYKEKKYDSVKEPWKYGKKFVHFYVVLKIFENNKPEITEDMLINIKKLYDSTEDSKEIIEWVITEISKPLEE
jgi:hypothetical protein